MNFMEKLGICIYSIQFLILERSRSYPRNTTRRKRPPPSHYLLAAAIAVYRRFMRVRFLLLPYLSGLFIIDIERKQYGINFDQRLTSIRWKEERVWSICDRSQVGKKKSVDSKQETFTLILTPQLSSFKKTEREIFRLTVRFEHNSSFFSFSFYFLFFVR